MKKNTFYIDKVTRSIEDAVRGRGLDEVGFVGGQRSSALAQDDIDKTVQYLKDKKADKPGSRVKKSKSVIKVK